MARAKIKAIKNKGKEKEIKTVPPEENVEETETADVENFPLKNKKDPVIALDEHVEVEIPEEKPEEEVPVKIEEEEDLLGEEIGLDDEELNPFGDKWEE